MNTKSQISHFSHIHDIDQPLIVGIKYSFIALYQQEGKLHCENTDWVWVWILLTLNFPACKRLAQIQGKVKRNMQYINRINGKVKATLYLF